MHLAPTRRSTPTLQHVSFLLTLKLISVSCSSTQIQAICVVEKHHLLWALTAGFLISTILAVTMATVER